MKQHREDISASANAVNNHSGRSEKCPPIENIPAEIMCKIFQDTVPTTLTGLRDMAHLPPWTLLPVCKLWHDICLSCGFLWSRIHIDYTSPAVEFPNFFSLPHHTAVSDTFSSLTHASLINEAVRFLTLLLERSGNVDIYVTIDARPDFDYAQPFFRVLYPHLRRCISLTAPRHIVLHTPFSHCERLSHITIDYASGPSGRRVWKSPGSHPDTPALQAQEQEHIDIITSRPQHSVYAVTLQDPRLYIPPNAFLLLERITKLVLDVANTSERIGEILPQLGSIVHLDLAERISTSSAIDQPYVSPSQESNNSVELLSLKYLALRGLPVICLVLGSIVAPNLGDLTYCGPIEREGGVLLHFLSSMSSGSMRALVLRTDAGPSTIIRHFTGTHSEIWTCLDNIDIDALDGDSIEDITPMLSLLEHTQYECGVFQSLTSLTLGGKRLEMTALESSRSSN